MVKEGGYVAALINLKNANIFEGYNKVERREGKGREPT